MKNLLNIFGIKQLVVDHTQCAIESSTLLHTGGVLLFIREDLNFLLGGDYILGVSTGVDPLSLDLVVEMYWALMFGYFNLDYYGNSYYCNNMTNLSNMFGIKQLVDDHTQCKIESSPLVDYALASFYHGSALVHNVPRVADHSIISAKICNGGIGGKNKKLIRTLG
ncbi:hypothetical protein HHI36_018159 [Cryptolaemus montrouzieri]|uniref:Uncharacterized protein n=1 Tax=Cryptolaemus montrouzieri TaxID=559131 RepID=A0ABD2NZS9_9CUCU